MAEWTDERMDDLAARMDAGFERVDNDIRELRVELRDTRRDLRAEIGATRTELRGDIAELRGELKGDIAELRKILLSVGVALVVGLISLIGASVGAPG